MTPRKSYCDWLVRFAAGLVLTSQLALHYESAGQQWEAAQQFFKLATEMRELGSVSAQASALRRTLACLKQCKEDDPSQRLELQTLAALMTTWTLERAETEPMFTRLEELRNGGAKDAISVDMFACMCFAVAVGIWASHDYFSLITPNSLAKLSEAEHGEAATCCLRASELLQNQAPSSSWGLGWQKQARGLIQNVFLLFFFCFHPDFAKIVITLVICFLLQ